MSSDAQAAVFIATLLHEQGQTGVQTHFNTFRRHLEESGRDARVVTPFDSPRSLVHPVFAMRRLIDPFSGAASVWWYRHWHTVFLKLALKRLLSKGERCVVYAQCPLSARAALDARVHRRQRVIMAVHFNGSQAEEWSEKGKIGRMGPMARGILRLEDKTLTALDGIVYVSRFMKELLEQRIPALRQISNAVIPNFCHQAPLEDGQAEPVDIISVGTLEPRKNQQFLLHVLAEAARHGRRYSLALVGNGPDRHALERLAQRLDIACQVRFLGYRKNAVERMRSAKLYAHCATVENLPLAVIEAMSCALPVLAPAVGGIPDLIEEGRQGFFWSTDSIEPAARLLIRLMEDCEIRQRLGAAALTRFNSHFSAERVAHRLADFVVGSQQATHAPLDGIGERMRQRMQ